MVLSVTQQRGVIQPLVGGYFHGRRALEELTAGTTGPDTGRAATVSLRCMATSSTIETEDTKRQREMDRLSDIVDYRPPKQLATLSGEVIVKVQWRTVPLRLPATNAAGACTVVAPLMAKLRSAGFIGFVLVEVQGLKGDRARWLAAMHAAAMSWLSSCMLYYRHCALIG